MKKKELRTCLIILMGLLQVCALGFGQIIENPAKPKAANAGRVVVAEEVLAISDEGTRDYYFDVPRDLVIAPDGSLILIDKSQVLHFNKDGKFVRNLLKKGQGPGEMALARACLPTEESIIVHADSPPRLVFFDYDGKYEKEIPIRSLAGPKFMPKTLLAYGERFYLQSADWPRAKGDPEFIEVPHSIIALDAKTSESRALSSFPIISYVISGADGESGLYEISSFLAVPFKGRYLVISHTNEYDIKIYDPSADKVIREFRRVYERVKPEPPTEIDKIGMKVGGKRYPRPAQKFQSDIKVILTRNDQIWAVTSTQDKSKGVLIDIFNGEGVFLDNFYLKLRGGAFRDLRWSKYCILDGDSLWVAESDEDDIFAIRKYRLGIYYGER